MSLVVKSEIERVVIPDLAHVVTMYLDDPNDVRILNKNSPLYGHVVRIPHWSNRQRVYKLHVGKMTVKFVFGYYTSIIRLTIGCCRKSLSLLEGYQNHLSLVKKIEEFDMGGMIRRLFRKYWQKYTVPRYQIKEILESIPIKYTSFIRRVLDTHPISSMLKAMVPQPSVHSFADNYMLNNVDKAVFKLYVTECIENYNEQVEIKRTVLKRRKRHV